LQALEEMEGELSTEREAVEAARAELVAGERAEDAAAAAAAAGYREEIHRLSQQVGHPLENDR
jgi:hypothetical protein